MFAKRSRCENELHEITPAGQFKLPIPVQLRFIDNDAGEKRPTSEYKFVRRPDLAVRKWSRWVLAKRKL